MSASVVERLHKTYGDRVIIGSDFDAAEDFLLEMAPTGRIVIGDRVSVRRGTTIQVSPGAEIIVGSDVAIGENVFMAAMTGIYIGAGTGISNMVDIHDHNHRPRQIGNLADDSLTTYSSGFVSAPIVIAEGAVIGNKTTLTAGCYVGQNTMIGANSVVSSALGPNLVAVGTPAREVKHFDGVLRSSRLDRSLRVAFFGTSIMQHLEARSSRLIHPWDLPPIGSTVVVEAWEQRGYVHRILTTLRSQFPWVRLEVTNCGIGGATSRDVLNAVENAAGADSRFDLALLGCGINDVWRQFQGRDDEAVLPEEYADNYSRCIDRLMDVSRSVVAIAETPFGTPECEGANPVLRSYNLAAAGIAASRSVAFIDTWHEFMTAGRCSDLDPSSSLSPWTDGVHLSEVGDDILHRAVIDYLNSTDTVARLLRLDPVTRDTSLAVFSAMRQAMGDH